MDLLLVFGNDGGWDALRCVGFRTYTYLAAQSDVRTPQMETPPLDCALNVTVKRFEFGFHCRDSTPLNVTPPMAMSMRLPPRCNHVPVAAPPMLPSAFRRIDCEFRMFELMSLP